MEEVEVKFEREDLEGVVAVGTYIDAAAGRMGIEFEGPCAVDLGEHCCSVTIVDGSDHLSKPTKLETEYFHGRSHDPSDRLACQTRFESPGEVVIMTKEKDAPKTEATAEAESAKYAEDFTGLPLEQKIATLVRLEAIALSETVSFVFNSPYLVFDKLLDVLGEFGLKKDAEARSAKRPTEHA